VQRRSWLFAALTMGTLAFSAAVSAQESDPPNVVEAREHLRRGTAMLQQENYDSALAEFERAYQLVGEHPSRHLILFNIARAHELRFRYDLAIEYYQRYLNEAPADSPQRQEVQVTMRTLEGMLATVHIESNVPAEVWIDDRMVGNAPGDVRTTSGRHVVELRAPGYTEGRQELQIAARETRTMTFEMSQLAAEYRGISSVFFFGATGLAAASALVGGGFGIAAMMRRGDVDAQLADPVRRLDGGSLEAAASEIDTYALVADVLFGTAALFAITAVVLAFLTDFGGAPSEESEAAPAASLTPFLGPDAAGVALMGAF
jgi:tetratricopeptide (TPR) repeat protein